MEGAMGLKVTPCVILTFSCPIPLKVILALLIRFFQIPGKLHLGGPFPRPSVMLRYLPSLTIFLTQIHRILALLLSSLSSSLELPRHASFTEFHRVNASSPDILRLLHYPAQPHDEKGTPQAAHTDLGSLTLLFTKSLGLQVLPPDSTQWTFVVPKPDCAVINIGDGTFFPDPFAFIHQSFHLVCTLNFFS